MSGWHTGSEMFSDFRDSYRITELASLLPRKNHQCHPRPRWLILQVLQDGFSSKEEGEGTFGHERGAAKVHLRKSETNQVIPSNPSNRFSLSKSVFPGTSDTLQEIWKHTGEKFLVSWGRSILRYLLNEGDDQVPPAQDHYQVPSDTLWERRPSGFA